MQNTLYAAAEYCILIEESVQRRYETNTFIDLLHVSLTHLYSCAILLPAVNPVLGDDKEEEIIYYHATAEMRNALQVMLGNYTDYSQAFDPIILDSADNFSEGWLTDDILDVYSDLKRVLKRIERDTDTAVQDALSQLKWGLGSHWGNHVINALRFLHYIRYDRLGRHI